MNKKVERKLFMEKERGIKITNVDDKEQFVIGGVSTRFVVDERNGCIGIRDTKHPDFNKSNGLNQDMPDVVAFEMGTRIDTGNFITWDLEPKLIEEFKDRCSFLNEC